MSSELDLHKQFISWLRQMELPYVHSRTDRRTTTAIGEPDFYVFALGRVIGIELKTATGKVSPAQAKRFAQLQTHGGVPVKLCRTLPECLHAVYSITHHPYSSSRRIDVQGVEGCKVRTETYTT